uniref:Interleukin-1 receptor accessory protein n=1 Tax=Oryzias sinensis TaxID=183150 RepID=A0A8C7YD65_9TELE
MADFTLLLKSSGGFMSNVNPIGRATSEVMYGVFRLRSRGTCDPHSRLGVTCPTAQAGRGFFFCCFLPNKSSCSKIAMGLKLLRRDQVTPAGSCEPPVATLPTPALIPLQEGKTLDCPDLKDATSMSDSPPTGPPFWNSDREPWGSSLRFYTMVDHYQGLYYCTVHFQRGGKQLNFTRAVNVTAISESLRRLQTRPHAHTRPGNHFLSPQIPPAYSRAALACRATVPFVVDDPSWDVWWTVDGQTLEKLSDQRFSQSNRVLKDDHMDLTVENLLLIQDFRSDDLRRRFNCSVKNARGSESRRALLREDASLPSVELGCGLGVTLVLMLLLFVVYHVFWLELLLLYRSWFGTDERFTDEKDFDVYISYARNGEEEQFVLNTLRGVLENEFGYSVCIFDRDSLPGGTITDETLSFVARSRRLLVVVSPGYASRGSQALLELKAGLQGMALGGHLRVILVQYKPVQRQDLVRELRKAQVALALVRWQGEKSKELSSRFWKRLRVELRTMNVNDLHNKSLF